ncbi:MAG TPA: flagellar basal body rod protein FlgC [Alphaproteobacteria bacterium]|nr:flagellar basal body rod protein FlgC [Alphaproteobacteria bacterium]HCS22501.1 flagellar basal body rod protein FlgC [Rhodospirillaceae bacterium]HRI75989.1 flagellar basal body rod protein FlgC [Alphaproteobacteria bacterium]HRJ67109.1 flagellar basal body rod protein FlgC [Alphaproteobacteria bacterium]
MDLVKAMALAAKGMKAQGVRMKVISENLANADTTPSSPGQEPYRRQVVTFKNELDRSEGVRNVEVDRIEADNSDFLIKYAPNHPAADEMGYIRTPNVNSLVEMMDMREAQRSYEANLGVIEMSRGMLMRMVDLLRG